MAEFVVCKVKEVQASFSGRSLVGQTPAGGLACMSSKLRPPRAWMWMQHAHCMFPPHVLGLV